MKNGVLASSKGNCVSLRTVPGPENSLCNLDSDSENPDLVHVHQSSDFALRSPKYYHFVSCLSTESPYHDHVLHYTAGLIRKKLVYCTKCPLCVQYLLSSCNSGLSSTFTSHKNNGGLMIPLSGIVKVVQLCDKILRSMLFSSPWGPLRCV